MCTFDLPGHTVFLLMKMDGKIKYIPVTVASITFEHDWDGPVMNVKGIPKYISDLQCKPLPFNLTEEELVSVFEE